MGRSDVRPVEGRNPGMRQRLDGRQQLLQRKLWALFELTHRPRRTHSATTRSRIETQHDAALLSTRVDHAIGIHNLLKGKAMIDDRFESILRGQSAELVKVFNSFAGWSGDHAMA